MEPSKERPGASPAPPMTDGAGPELLQHLLTCELARLKTAMRIENERAIVFPETSIIIRDIMRLREAIVAGQRGKAAPLGDEADEELSRLLAEMGASGE